MTVYVRDPNGVTHIVDSSGDGEFTFCSREQGSYGGDGFGPDGEFQGEVTNGPANCEDCNEAVATIRRSIAGIRWSKNLKPAHYN